MFDWTADRVEALLVHYKAGSSTERIARSMGGGLTRNAVIGKLHRMGQFRFRVPAAPKEGGPKREKRQRGVDGGLAFSMGAKKKRHARAKLTYQDGAFVPDPTIERDGMRDLPPDQSPDAVSLFEATDTQCRWPLNDAGPGFLFCGSKTVTDDCSWCARHARMAFSPSSRPKKEDGGRPYIPSRGAAY